MDDQRRGALPADSLEARTRAKAETQARGRAKALYRAEARAETEANTKAVVAKRRTKMKPAAVGGNGEATPRRRAEVSRGNIWALIVVTFVGVVAAVHEFPTFIILACGMPPALVAALIDDKPGRHASSCVLVASLAGITPVLAALWLGENTIFAAMMLVSDVYVWFGMYGAAAIGWMLVWLFPMIAEIALAVSATQRIDKLRRHQGRLVAEWGDIVAGRAKA